MKDKLKYIKVDSFKNLPIIKLATVQDFMNLLEEFKPKHLFSKVEKQSENEQAQEKTDFLSRTKGLINSVAGSSTNSEFYFVAENTVYAVDGKGYNNLEDCEKGAAANFENGEDYYASVDGGYNNFEEYQQSLSDGFKTKEEFEKAKNTGFIGGVAKLNAAKMSGELKDAYYSKIKSIKKDGDLYRYAKDSGYESFIEFKDAIYAGYVGKDATEFRSAKKSGFGTAEAYQAAQKGSFEDPAKFVEAQALGIDSKVVFDRYKTLDTIKIENSYGFLDQANVYDLLKNLDSGKLISFGKISERLKESQTTVKPSLPNNTKDWLNVKISKLMKMNTTPEWYTTSFKTDEELKAFIINDEHIQKLGEYDQNSDVFIRS